MTGTSAHTVDVAVARFADTVFEDGPADLLFNNAGIGVAALVIDTTVADWRRLIDVNLMGVVHGLNAILPRLLAQDRPAHIMNTATMAGLVPAVGLGSYSATRAAVVALAETLDIEMIGTCARVSALCHRHRNHRRHDHARGLERPTRPHGGLLRQTRHVPGPRGRPGPFRTCADDAPSPHPATRSRRTVSCGGCSPRAGRALSKISFRLLSRDE